MNLTKKIVYVITFLAVFLVLPYFGYKFYLHYQIDLRGKLTEREEYEYTTPDGDYTVKFMDTNTYGAEEYLKYKIYLIDNSDGEIYYIATHSFDTYSDSTIECSVDDEAENYTIDITFRGHSSDDFISADCELIKSESIFKLLLSKF